MNTLLIWAAGLLGVLFLWGTLSPRSQWYLLVGWTRSDPRATEPGAAAYSVTRVVSLVGVLALLTVGVSSAVGQIDFAREDNRAVSDVDRVWGMQPRAYVVDRVFRPIAVPPEDLVEMPITGFQSVDRTGSNSDYLFEAGKIRSAGQATEPGFIGVEPIPGTVALDTADLVVRVRGDDRCIPQQLVVVGADGAVQVGAFFGQSDPGDGSNEGNVSNCDSNPPVERSRGYLIPIDLASPLGNRELQSLDGTPIEVVGSP
ncbi:hypothetical protein [Marisediminicola sp. LYQ85]|uniref:hypothetical protein n=1 Tax=Marisediminicola sp. LYQ85 TaxID=3391062 RepID=UPI0039835385